MENLIDKLYLINTEPTFIRAINEKERNVIGYVIDQHHLPKDIREHPILVYRYHLPTIELLSGVLKMLEKLQSRRAPIYLITDGRGVTQHLKIISLKIFISEQVRVGKHGLD